VNAALPSSAQLVSGSKVFSVTLKTAGSATITSTNSTHTAIPSSTSPSIAVSAGLFTRLQILVPGETAAPGTINGKSGTPSTRTAGSVLNVTVNAVDAKWNGVNSVTDVAGITSTDVNAIMPANAALVNRT